MSQTAGAVVTISLGLPVLPPDVMALNELAIFSGSWASESAGSGSYPVGSV